MDCIKQITNLILGIRFSKSFRIDDISGAIIDDILYGNKSPFTDIFKKVEVRGFERVLLSDSESTYLRIGPEDLIISLGIKNDFKRMHEWLKNGISEYFEHIIFPNHKIIGIRRIGVVYIHSFGSIKNLDDVIASLTFGKVTNVNNIKLSFAKKIQDTEHLIHKDIKNHKNIIYSFEQKENEYIAGLDYQFIFDPIQTALADCKIKNIINDSYAFLIRDYYDWVDKHVE